MFDLPTIKRMNQLPQIDTGIPKSKKDKKRIGQQQAWIVKTEKGEYLQSYQSKIVFIDKQGQVYIDDTFWNYSVTTARHRRNYLNEGRAETEQKMLSGEYILCNLF